MKKRKSLSPVRKPYPWFKALTLKNSLLGRVVHQVPVVIEAGAVAWTVPGLFFRIPSQLAAQMRAFYGNLMKLSPFIPVNTVTLQTHPQNAGFTSFRRIPGSKGPMKMAFCKPHDTELQIFSQLFCRRMEQRPLWTE